MSWDEVLTRSVPSGATLRIHVRRPVRPPRAIVQVNHGLAEHGARYLRFADFLAAQGVETWVHDHRGHGHTTAPDAPPRMFARDGGAGKVVADILAVHDLIAGESPGLPVVLFGHSMGGLAGLNFLIRHSERVDAAAIWNANFSAGLPGRAAQAVLAWERFRLGSDVPSRILPGLTFQTWAKQVPNRRTEFDWLSRDAAEVDKYVADPLCGWDASVSMWRDVFGFVFAGADDAALARIRRTLPFNLVGGEKDPATGGGKSVMDLAHRLQRLGFQDIQASVLDDTRHESLNEVNREDIMGDFGRWLDRVLVR